METNIETTHTIDLSDRMYRLPIIMISVVALLGIGFIIYAFEALPQNAPHEIQVSGDGKAYAKPDIALISFGAHTEAEKSQDAVSKNNDIVNAVISAVKALGVDEKDIQTTSYNLSPVYDYNKVMPMMGGVSSGAVSYPYPGPSGSPVVRGYALDQQVQVKIRNFDNINAILDAATKSGANTIGSLQFTVDDYEKVRADARNQAIAAAKEKAKGMFAAAGLSGAKIVNISEGYAYPVPMYATTTKDAGSGSTAPNIQAGQMEIDTTVTLTYRVK